MKNLFRFFCLAAVFSANIFAGGKGDKNTPPNLRMGILNGPTSIPAAYILENVSDIDGVSVSYEIFADPQSLLARMLRGEIDVAFLPPNIAAKTYTDANAAVVCIGVSGYGNLSLVTKDCSINSLEDLRGKTVSVAGAGGTPEYMFRWLLQKHGIPSDGSQSGVRLDFSIPNANIAASLVSDQISYAVVPEPFATVASTRSQHVRRAIDLQKEFANVAGGENYPLTLMIATNQFAKSNKSTIKKFITQFETAVAWTNSSAEQAGRLVEKHTLGLAAPTVANAIAHANFVWLAAGDARPQIESLLAIFLEFSPESVGGKLPGGGFYFD